MKYVKVKQIHYDGYDPNTRDSDIAILELDEELTFSEVNLLNQLAGCSNLPYFLEV